jgi:hypothetical protein
MPESMAARTFLGAGCEKNMSDPKRHDKTTKTLANNHTCRPRQSGIVSSRTSCVAA